MPFLFSARPVLGKTTLSGRTRGKAATLEAECYEKAYSQQRQPPKPYDHGVEANAQAHHGEAFTITHRGASRRKKNTENAFDTTTTTATTTTTTATTTTTITATDTQN